MNGPAVLILASFVTLVVAWLIVRADRWLDDARDRRNRDESRRYANAMRRIAAAQRHPSNRTRIGHTRKADND
jgi:hypothetical protein